MIPKPAIAQTPLGGVEYATVGDGPAVLALHGAMGGYDQGLLLARTTVGQGGFRAVAISRPGYLGTPLACGRTPDAQADLYATVLDKLAIEQTAVIAISGGGQSALQFALRHPGRCRALVMISACSAQLHDRVPFRFHLLRLMARIPGMVNRLRAKAAADSEAAARRSIPDPALRARTLADPEAGPLLTALQLSVLDRMAQRLGGTANDIRQSRAPFQYAVEKIAAPVLVVHGTADEVVPFAQATSLAGRIPAARLLAIEDGRHVSIFTHRGQIQPEVRRFVGA